MGNNKLVVNSTQIPNIILDEWMPNLSGIELMVVMIIARQTYGWHKDTDRISYSQLVKKTGVSRRAIAYALNTLKEKGLINIYQDGQDLSYSIKTSAEFAPVQKLHPTSAKIAHTKETITKENTFTKVKGTSPNDKTDNRLKEGWQYYALEVSKLLNLDQKDRSRMFEFTRGKDGYFLLEKAKQLQNRSTFTNLPQTAKVNYIITTYRRSI